MKLHFFSKGLTHDFRQKLQISSMFFDSTSQGIMSHDHLVKKKRPPSLYKYGFHVVMILNFLKWLSDDFRQKMKISPFFFLNKMGFEKIFDHHLVRETSPPRRK